MLTECGLTVTTNDCFLKTKDGINFLNKLYKELGQIPTGTYINSLPNVNRAWFSSKFGDWNNALFEAGIVDKNYLISKEQCVENSINYLKLLSDQLQRVPTATEFDNFLKKQEKKTAQRRVLSEELDMTYIEICDEYLDYATLNKFGGNILVNNNGKKCKSADEVNISNILIYNDIKHEYEPSYKDAMNIQCRYKFDWVIYDNNNKAIYVEYFGLFYEENDYDVIKSYVRKTYEKIQICTDHSAKLISLFPDDLKKGFSGRIRKFLEFDIMLI